MKKLVVPKFATEREEANWWDAQKPTVEANLLEAMRNGTIGRGIVKRLALESRESKSPKKSSRH
jgi:hypothetical protein